MTVYVRECVSGCTLRLFLGVIYGLELGLFSLPARQEMKLCIGCCGKGTLPVYP